METKPIRIVVLQRGWIVVGVIADYSEQELRMERASVIRCWGTTKGLGEIAAHGPTDRTILDPCGIIHIHPLTIVLQIDADQEKWHERL